MTGSGVFGWGFAAGESVALGTTAHVPLTAGQMAAARTPDGLGGIHPCEAHRGRMPGDGDDGDLSLRLWRHWPLTLNSVKATSHYDFALFAVEATPRQVYGFRPDPRRLLYTVAVFEGWVDDPARLDAVPATAGWPERKLDEGWVVKAVPGLRDARRLWVPGRKAVPTTLAAGREQVRVDVRFAGDAVIQVVPEPNPPAGADPARPKPGTCRVVVRVSESVGAVGPAVPISRELVDTPVFLCGPRGLVWGEVVAAPATAFGVRYRDTAGPSASTRFDGLLAVCGLDRPAFAGAGDSGSPVGMLDRSGTPRPIGHVLCGIDLELPKRGGGTEPVAVTFVQGLPNCPAVWGVTPYGVTASTVK